MPIAVERGRFCSQRVPVPLNRAPRKHKIKILRGTRAVITNDAQLATYFSLPFSSNNDLEVGLLDA